MLQPTVLSGMFGEFVFTPKKNTDFFMTDALQTPDKTLYIECTDLIGLYPVGVLIKYPDGTKRFIKDITIREACPFLTPVFNELKQIACIPQDSEEYSSRIMSVYSIMVQNQMMN